jgi:hypothetical protein
MPSSNWNLQLATETKETIMRTTKLLLAIVTLLAVTASAGNAAAPTKGKQVGTYPVQDKQNIRGDQQDRFRTSY